MKIWLRVKSLKKNEELQECAKEVRRGITLVCRYPVKGTENEE